MTFDDIEKVFLRRNVRPTANRMVIMRELLCAGAPLSMADLEARLVTIDKSGLSRSLGLFAANHMVHIIEDGSGAAKYEACPGHDDHSVGDMHPHFHCEVCGMTFCLENIAVPQVSLPDGYSVNSINYVIKGMCAECRNQHDC